MAEMDPDPRESNQCGSMQIRIQIFLTFFINLQICRMAKVQKLIFMVTLLSGWTAALEREMWSTVAHHERDIERVAARRVLQEEGEEAHTRHQRKVDSSAAEKVEGRFFLQDKLCALGLAEVKTVAGYINQFTEVCQ
jgi:hypothetical protein